MIKNLLFKIPLFKSFRFFGYPIVLPINLTINSTFHCVSRCQTCNVWKKRVNELSLSEWKKIFRSIGPNLYWLIISGGEPFLRKDLVKLCQIAYFYTKPKIINIPTNGFLYESMPEKIEKILSVCPKSKIIVNFSLDALGEDHNKIRQLDKSFENFLKSFYSIRKIKHPNLTVGVHTVISKLNYQKLPKIYDFVTKELKPDSYIAEIAEEREELGTLNFNLTPSIKEYREAADFLIKKIEQNRPQGISKITYSLRKNYYRLVEKTLKKKTQIIPCYGGFASAQISADGKVWSCCVKAYEMGDLRKENYDFPKIWKSKKSAIIRKSIKSKECYCPLASASYTSMLMNAKTLGLILTRLIFK